MTSFWVISALPKLRMNKLLLSLNVVCAPWFSISKETDSAVLSSQRWKYSLLNPVAFPIPSSTITKNGFSLGVTKNIERL